ncbi:DNA replication/repair protein RecF [Micropruina glycogenica]|uniref:DNA replication and repair protein RecF n=1 Tax=Micropruina glycogenica TaxID=75385 RepID=A0A2N9JKR6_9ACTN|nr:DNA replication/repair protein RecF [Micropruina glycogenica]SPD88172.1 DNA replication and repair protein RecF [Micropruina glycogenica]
MFVTHLSLADFRSYAGAEVALEPGVTTFTGANGQGKTNLVEAVDYLATLGSHRVSSEQPLVRHGAERAIVRARVQAGADDTRQLLLEIEILPGRQNKASLNRAPLRRPRELLGALRTVVFSPEDLALVKGDPSERRRFLDELITTRWPRLAGVRADYERVLRQRSTLLKSLAGRGRTLRDDVETTLGVWDESLARFGAELMHARLDTLAALAPHVADAYSAIAPTNNDATLEYRCAIGAEVSTSQDEIEARLIMAMGERRADEIQRGVCLVGPHRDDLVLALGELPARGYASHGESWSFALALRLGAFALLRADGVEPVLILDDVFAELDQLRRERLAGMIAEAEQVLITAAVPHDVPAELGGRRFRVGGGEVSEVNDARP